MSMRRQRTNEQPKTWVEVSREALKANIRTFKSLIGSKTQLMAIVKSNAYGHGLVQTAQVAQSQGVSWFGVDSLEEGIELRKNSIRGSILVLGYIRPQNIKVALVSGLSFVAYDPGVLTQLKLLSKRGFLKKHPALVHLKVETGTGRQGLAGQELYKFAERLQKIPSVSLQGLYTHLANVEDTTDHAFAFRQLKRFVQEKSWLSKLGIQPSFCHVAGSAAATLLPETHFNLIRLGISLYGLWPSKETRAIAQKLHRNIRLFPALTWKTVVAQIKSFPKGSSIGYGLTERLSRQSKIAVLPVGYGDGYDRGLSSIGSVLIRGSRCKIVGRICMNMCMVDVTDVRGIKVQNEVVLIGGQKKENISAEEFAQKIGTINYEVVARINSTIPRVITD